MFAVSKGQKRKIDKLNCTYRFVRKTDPKNPANSGICCEIIDVETSPVDHAGQPDPARAIPYATGFGETEPDALDAALKEAEMAPKPMTKAQRARDPVLAEKIKKLEQEHYAERKAAQAEGEEDDEDYDPEPSDKRTREWRLWDQRQKERDKQPATAAKKED